MGEIPSDSSDTQQVDSLHHPDQYFPYLDDGTPWRRTSDVQWKRLSLILVGFAISDAVGFKKLSDFWYKTERSSFHFHEGSRDIREYKQMDKISHFIDGYYFSHLASKIFRWGGLSVPRSVMWGSVTGFVWLMQIEVVDGFFKNWGFSYFDFIMNVAGCSYSAMQQLYPEQLQGIRFKASYRPSVAYKNDWYSTVSKSWLDDYEGFTLWVSLNIHDLLPDTWQRKYPRWLAPWGISFGHSAQGIATDVFGGQRELFIGLDLDLNKIPVGNNKFVKFWRDEFNFLRMPLPTVQVTPRTIWFGFYF